MKKWILFSLPIVIALSLSIARAQATPHSASYTVSGGGPNVTSYNCYKGSTTGGPYTKFAPAAANGLCTDTNVGTAGTKSFYVATAINASGESGFSNEMSGVAVGTNPPQAGAVSEQ